MKSLEQLQREYTGDGKPWFFRASLTPRYSEFRIDWQDSVGRQYMRLEDAALAVRLPINRGLELPNSGDQLELVKPGDGHVWHITVAEVASRKRKASVHRLSIL